MSSDCADESKFIGKKLAPFNPTNVECILQAIDMLRINDHDIVFDLGCGDGRFLIEACKKFPLIRCVGVEYDKELSLRAEARAAEQGFQHCITIMHDNVLNVDLSQATVIFIYLVPEGLNLLSDRLSTAFEAGCRIVSYVFAVPGLVPVQTQVYKSSTKLYLYEKT